MTAATVTMNATTASGKVGQPVTLTMNFNQTSGTVDCILYGIYGICTSGNRGTCEIEAINITPSYAGTGTATTPVTIAASASAVLYPVKAVFHVAGTYTVNLIAFGTTGGVPQSWIPATACTVTIT